MKSCVQPTHCLLQLLAAVKLDPSLAKTLFLVAAIARLIKPKATMLFFYLNIIIDLNWGEQLPWRGIPGRLGTRLYNFWLPSTLLHNLFKVEKLASCLTTITGLSCNDHRLGSTKHYLICNAAGGVSDAIHRILTQRARERFGGSIDWQ